MTKRCKRVLVLLVSAPAELARWLMNSVAQSATVSRSGTLISARNPSRGKVSRSYYILGLTHSVYPVATAPVDNCAASPSLSCNLVRFEIDVGGPNENNTCIFTVHTTFSFFRLNLQDVFFLRSRSLHIAFEAQARRQNIGGQELRSDSFKYQ